MYHRKRNQAVDAGEVPTEAYKKKNHAQNPCGGYQNKGKGEKGSTQTESCLDKPLGDRMPPDLGKAEPACVANGKEEHDRAASSNGEEMFNRARNQLESFIASVNEYEKQMASAAPRPKKRKNYLSWDY